MTRPRKIIDALENAHEPPDPLKLARFPRNDLGLTERLRVRYGDRIAYTEEAGWLAWNGTCWVWGDAGEAIARTFAHQTAEAIWGEYEVWEQHERARRIKEHGATFDEKAFNAECRDFARFAIDAGNSNRTSAMLREAKVYLQAELKDFDPDPFRICCPNGTLEIAFIDEPCIVTEDTTGAVTGFVRVSETASGTYHLDGWAIEALPDRIWRLGEETFDESALKQGVWIGEERARNRRRVTHRLYHLDIQLVPHDPAHRITRMTNCDYDPAAKAPRWQQHIKTVLSDDGDRAWFQRAMGYGLTGSIKSQCFLFLQGKGGDGKTTTLKAIRRAIGSYATTCDPRSWMEMKQRSAADASPDVAGMAGDTRLLTCEEPPRGVRVNESMLKAATGGDPIKARHLHKSLFSFEPRFLLTMAFNDLPRITGGDDGFWRRLRLIRFRHQFTADEIERGGDIDLALQAEASGILNWLLVGLGAWRKHGLEPTSSMLEDIEEYRSQANTFDEWARVRIIEEPGARVANAELRQDYQAYCEAENIDPKMRLGPRAFANKLSSQQFEKTKIRGERYRVGIKLAPKRNHADDGE